MAAKHTCPAQDLDRELHPRDDNSEEDRLRLSPSLSLCAKMLTTAYDGQSRVM